MIYLQLLMPLMVAPGLAANQEKIESRPEITINDTNVSPENLTSSKNGTVYFGSTSKGNIYRALPNSARAEPWILAKGTGLSNVLGVLADDKSNTLWVCSNAPFGQNTDNTGQPALRAFDLATGSVKGIYPSPGGGAFNDIAIGKDGSVYVSDTFDARIFRLPLGGKGLETWLSDPQLRGIDGLTFLADGALYINNFFNGKLSRIPVKPDGSAGPITDIQTSVPFRQPDGLRTSGPKTMLQVEGQGRLTEITIDGDKGEVRVIKEGLTRAAGLTQIGPVILVLVERLKGVFVPMAAGSK